MTDQEKLINAALEITLLKQSAEQRTKQVESLAVDIKIIKQTLDEVARALQEAKGCWRVLMMVGGAFSVILSIPKSRTFGYNY